jgi:hypothetical protein
MASSGTYTDARSAQLASLDADDVGTANAGAPSLRLAYFRIGEGGQTSGTPNTPDPTLTDIEAQGVGTNGLHFFEKAFDPGDVTRSGKITTIVCHLEAGEGNDPGGGHGDPVYYELGIYDDTDTLVAYLTFDGETKTSSDPLQHVVKIQYP